MLDMISVDIEITNHCKNGCRFCPHHSMKRPRGYMDSFTFVKAVDLARRSNALVTLSGMGDPLAHQDFFEFIKILKGASVRFGVVINPASLLRSIGIISRFQDAKVPSLTISFPSSRREVFEWLVPGCGFEDALEVTLALNEIFKGYGGTLRVQGVITSINKDEMGTYLDFWKGHGVRGWIRRCHSRGGHLKNGLNTASPTRHAECCWLFNVHGFIAWNGDLLACCHDLGGRSKMGNILLDGEEELRRARANAKGDWPLFHACSVCDEELRSPPSRIKKGLRRLKLS